MSDTKYVFCIAGEFSGRMIEFPNDHADRGVSEGWAIDPVGEDAFTIQKKLDQISDDDRAAAAEAYAQFVAERDAPTEEKKEEVRQRGRPKMTDEEKAAKAAERAEAKRLADEQKAAELQAQADADAKAAAKKAARAAAAGDDAATVAALDQGVAAEQSRP